jgi:hypothetical protein
MASQRDACIALARERVAKGRQLIGRQKSVIDIKREAGMDFAFSLNRLAEMQQSQLILEDNWEQLLREEDRKLGNVRLFCLLSVRGRYSFGDGLLRRSPCSVIPRACRGSSPQGALRVACRPGFNPGDLINI